MGFKIIHFILFFSYFSFITAPPPLTPETDLLHNFVMPSLNQVNDLRKQFGLRVLVLDDKLTSGAQEWAESEANNDQLEHSCGPCDHYSELLAEKITTGPVPTGEDASSWALHRWFGNLLDGTTPTSAAANAYASLIKKPNLASMGIGLAYGRTSRGEKTVFAVARFARASRSRG